MNSLVKSAFGARPGAANGARFPLGITTKVIPVVILALTAVTGHTPAQAGTWARTYICDPNGTLTLSMGAATPVDINYTFASLVFSEESDPDGAWGVYGAAESGDTSDAVGNVEGWIKAKFVWIPDSNENPPSTITVKEDSWVSASCVTEDPDTQTRNALLPTTNTSSTANPMLQLDNGFGDSVTSWTQGSTNDSRQSVGTHYTNVNVTWNGTDGVWEAIAPQRNLIAKFSVTGPLTSGNDWTSISVGFTYTANVY
jgi:hypothetical protein